MTSTIPSQSYDFVNVDDVIGVIADSLIYITGRVGKSLDTSAGRVDLGQHSAYNISGDFALSLWVQNSVPLGSGEPITLFGTTDKGVSLILDPTTGALRVQIETATDTDITSTAVNTRPDDSQWHHLVVDYDEPTNGRLRIVLDGTVVHDASWVPAPDGCTVDLTTADTWPGRMDEVLLFDRALTNWKILSRSRDTTIVDPPSVPSFVSRGQSIVYDPLILLTRSDTDPYGITRWNTTTNQIDTDAEEHGFTGQEKEADLGLYYYGARYYFPEVGRFLSNDPMREFWNPYSYVGNNPVMFVDPTGENWFWANEQWVWSDEPTYTYTSDDGTTITLPEEISYPYLVTFDATHTNPQGAAQGTLKIMGNPADGPLAENTSAFSGGVEGSIELFDGNYFINLYLGVDQKRPTLDSEGHLNPSWLFQDIPEVINNSNYRYAWGSQRVSLIPWPEVKEAHGYRSDGNYIHGWKQEVFKIHMVAYVIDLRALSIKIVS